MTIGEWSTKIHFILLTRIELLAFASLMADASRRSHDAYADQFEAKVGDPLYESVEGALIWELATKRGCVRPHADLAVVEFCPCNGIRLTHESDFVHS